MNTSPLCGNSETLVEIFELINLAPKMRKLFSEPLAMGIENLPLCTLIQG